MERFVLEFKHYMPKHGSVIKKMVALCGSKEEAEAKIPPEFGPLKVIDLSTLPWSPFKRPTAVWETDQVKDQSYGLKRL